MAGIGKAIKGLGLLAKKYKKAVSKKASSQMGWKKNLKERSQVFKEGQQRHKDLDLKEIHDKYFDKSGEMKQKGKDIVKEGLKGLKK
jgi:hypothetical protein